MFLKHSGVSNVAPLPKKKNLSVCFDCGSLYIKLY